MVTGDNIHTARHIARDCGILTEGGLALEGPAFRVMPQEEMDKMLPDLQARSGKTGQLCGGGRARGQCQRARGAALRCC